MPSITEAVGAQNGQNGHGSEQNGNSNGSGVFIVGLGHHYPPYTNGLEDIKQQLAKFCDMDTPAMKKIFQVNQGTGIRERPNIIARDDPLFNRSEPPTVTELDHVFRTRAVDLVAKACRKAIADWGGTTADITHTVAATGTNAGNPGYDLLVTEKIGVRAEAQRVLLNGIGCAGGLAAIRVAASIANDATLRGRPARILGFCCELTSTNVRADLQGIMANPNETKVAMTLFSDAGGSFVICNSRGLENPERAIFSVLDWESGILQGTQKDMQFVIDPLGFRFFLGREIPNITGNAVVPMLERMLGRNAWQRQEGDGELEAPDMDWVVHPGGLAILKKVRENLKLQDGQMQASFDVYEAKGNSSSPTVLIVLDRLRRMGEGRDNVGAVSFGPGMCIEMTAMKRCRAATRT